MEVGPMARTHLVLHPVALLEKLCVLVPGPRAPTR
jgi:hypothetical protein